ncbi:MAG: diguanylate cyclase [Anaerocolumna sp.]|nr:diguanylate cyclase [Anaerocolumna sp.]
MKDSLTNLHNHEYILEILEREVELQKQTPKGLVVMMLDIDHFKRVNDTYGHQKGDQVLIKIADVIQSCLRSSDFAGRYGGEEFMVILSGISGINSGIEVAERIKECISNCVFENNELRVTISIGLACYQGESTKELVGIADKLLYQAKGNGRNRIEYHKK